MKQKNYQIILHILQTKREGVENKFPEETRTQTQQGCIDDLLELETEFIELYNAKNQNV